MTTRPTIAVLLSWNDSDRVTAALRDLAASSAPPDHVVVVDNGSTDGSPERIEREFPGIDILRLRSNRGFAGGANAGIRRALERGAEWIWLLNTDIGLPADALARMRKAAVGERCGMVGAVLVNADGSVQALGGGRVSLRTGIARHERKRVDRCDYLSGACLLVRARMLREIGLFDERYFFYWEDVDLGFRARDAGWRLAVAGDCRVVHHEGTSLGQWTARRWYHLFRGMTRFLFRHAPHPRTAIAARLVHHTLTMAAHGRLDPIRGAWRALGSRRRGERRAQTRLGFRTTV